MMERSTSKITLAESVYERIRRDIITNQLKPGEKINIRELSTRYEASETPIRLALNRLASENIIEHFPRQGMRVKSLNINLCEETFDLRLMLESYYISNVIMTLNTNEAMRLALRRNVEDNLEIVHRLTPDSPLDDYLVNYEYDIGFHHLLIKCSGNKLLMDLYQFLNPFLYINYVYNKQSKERLLTGIQEHQEIMEHLLNGNEEGARQSLTTHLANSSASSFPFSKSTAFCDRIQILQREQGPKPPASDLLLPARYQRFPSASKGHSRGSSRISIMGLARASSSIPSEISISSRRMVSRMWTIRGFARSM